MLIQRERERSSSTLDHKGTMWELRSLSQDFFDRGLPVGKKSGEGRRALGVDLTNESLRKDYVRWVRPARA